MCCVTRSRSQGSSSLRHDWCGKPTASPHDCGSLRSGYSPGATPTPASRPVGRWRMARSRSIGSAWHTWCARMSPKTCTSVVVCEMCQYSQVCRVPSSVRIYTHQSLCLRVLDRLQRRVCAMRRTRHLRQHPCASAARARGPVGRSSYGSRSRSGQSRSAVRRARGAGAPHAFGRGSASGAGRGVLHAPSHGRVPRWCGRGSAHVQTRPGRQGP